VNDGPEPGPAPRATGRPIAVTIVAAISLAYGIVLAVSGVQTLLGADADRGELVAGSVDLFFGAVALLIAVGSFYGRRWAWVMFMTVAVWMLTINLLRHFFFDDPRYLPLAVGTLAVFLLTPLDIQVAFGVRPPPNIRLDARTRNPIDRI
jgi:hypothetical protein